jgi:hypothetical protein
MRQADGKCGILKLDDFPALCSDKALGLVKQDFFPLAN